MIEKCCNCNKKKKKSNKLFTIKKFLNGEQQTVYSALESELEILKNQYGKLLFAQSELEEELISTKVDFFFFLPSFF